MNRLIAIGLSCLLTLGCSLNPNILKDPIEQGSESFISLSINVDRLLSNFELLAKSNPEFSEEDQAFLDTLRLQMEGDLKVIGGMLFIVSKWVTDATDLSELLGHLPTWLEDVKLFKEQLTEAWKKLTDKKVPETGSEA
jgi:hypothetical protein